jgi:hypothetical protein
MLKLCGNIVKTGARTVGVHVVRSLGTREGEDGSVDPGGSTTKTNAMVRTLPSENERVRKLRYTPRLNPAGLGCTTIVAGSD